MVSRLLKRKYQQIDEKNMLREFWQRYHEAADGEKDSMLEAEGRIDVPMQTGKKKLKLADVIVYRVESLDEYQYS